MLAVDLPVLRNLVADIFPAEPEPAPVRPRDRIAFAGLVLQSAAIMLAPVGLCAVVLAL
jgi:hypothetical protein